MDFEFSQEAEQLRQTVRKWVERAYDPERRREVLAAGGLSRERWGELADLGICGLTLPEALGGSGLGPIEALVVSEELGRGLVLEPFRQSLIVSAMLSSADEATQQRWAEPLTSGRALLVLGYQERKARYQLDVCATRATKSGAGWRITGEKILVPAADAADAYILPAKIGEELALFVVERSATGLSSRVYATPSGARAGDLVLDDVPATLLTADGRRCLELAIDVGIAALCGEAVGLMERTLALTVDYVQTRKQFGVAIASFQALRHDLADMKMKLELARSMSYYANLKLGARADARRLACSRAKVQIGESMRFIGQVAVQLHGGMGLTDESLISHCFRTLTELEMTFGDTLHHVGVVSSNMGDVAGVYDS